MTQNDAASISPATTTRGVADVVFCIDASASMHPLLEGLRRHIGEFLRGLELDPQVDWDWRLDFIAHSAGEESSDLMFRHESVFQREVIDALYGLKRPEPDTGALRRLGRAWRALTGSQRTADALQQAQAVSQPAPADTAFFTPLVDVFTKGLDRIDCFGDEAVLVALDTCLDLPWREAPRCHRAIVVLTDEPAESGVGVQEQRERLSLIVKKVLQKYVALHIVAPESPIFDQLAMADGSDYEVTRDRGDGMASVDFSKLLRQIGQSVSRSISVPFRRGSDDADVPPALFGQHTWGSRTSWLSGR